MGYGTGRIEFVSNDRQNTKREYSDRSLIQLIEIDFPNAALHALDVEENKQKIFEIPLKNQDQYKYGNSKDDPDEVRSDNGTYRIWLSDTSRDGFHKELRTYFLQLELIGASIEDPPRPVPPKISHDTHEPKGASNDNYRVKPNQSARSDSSIVSPKDLLLDVHLLSQYIEQGNATKAAQIASQFASQGVRLTDKGSESPSKEEEEFSIQVQLDGNEYGEDQHGARIPVNVFQSTTVRELRALFELVHSYAPSNQYFFVNGCLAHDNSTMKELNVGPKSLFVLFLLKHSKKTGPWKCSACPTNNASNNLRCKSCAATRQN